MSKTLTACRFVLGPLLLIPAPLVWGLWMKSFEQGITPQERIQIFLSYFPSGMTLNELSWGPIACSMAAIVVGALSLIKSTTAERAVNFVVIILGFFISLIFIGLQIFMRL